MRGFQPNFENFFRNFLQENMFSFDLDETTDIPTTTPILEGLFI
jgi:hypothetical protein